nr:hypothetical protein [Staphylococcus epidermidis]
MKNLVNIADKILIGWRYGLYIY